MYVLFYLYFYLFYLLLADQSLFTFRILYDYVTIFLFHVQTFSHRFRLFDVVCKKMLLAFSSKITVINKIKYNFFVI